MSKEITTSSEIRSRKDYLTTPELARLCGVSRFTTLIWIKQGRVKTMKTVGGHHRIPLSEAISFFETLHNGNSGIEAESVQHCWEHPQKTNCHKECQSCLLYKSRINYCFFVVREFGKEAIHCKGDCLNCEYFEEFFSSYSKSTQSNETYDKKVEVAAKERKNFLFSLIYGVGRGLHGVKGTIEGVREKLGGSASRVKHTEKTGKNDAKV